MPLVSIIMTAYNEEKFIDEAIESLLWQTLSDFELIIINDGSNDNTKAIIESYNDKRVRLINNEKNIGAALSSNKGLKLVRGKYIARADADDINHPLRLQKQVSFLEENPEYNICGTDLNVVCENGQQDVWTYRFEDEFIKSYLIFNPHIAHPSTMLRSSLIKNFNIHYNPKYKRGIDYELYTRYENKLTFYNLNERLVTYRRHSNSLSSDTIKVRSVAGKIRKAMLNKLNITPNENEFTLHQTLSQPSEHDQFSVKEAINWLNKLKDANRRAMKYNEKFFLEVLALRLYKTMEEMNVTSVTDWKLFLDSEFSNHITLEEKSVELNKLFNFLNKNNYRKIAVFGTLRLGRYLASELKKQQFEIKCFIDNLKYKEIVMIDGIKVKPINEAVKYNLDLILVTVIGEHDQKIIDSINQIIKNTNVRVCSWKEFS